MGQKEDGLGGQYSGEQKNEQMNGWKGEVISPADTYIEWRFEQKCKLLSDGFRIITEWRKRKLQYVAISGTIIMDFQHYSRHDATHSIAILEMIELLLGKNRIDLLSAGDLWLLLEAAYSHDAGMAMTYDEMIYLWKEDDKFRDFIWNCIEQDLGDISQAAVYFKQMDNVLQEREKLEGLAGYEEAEFNDEWPMVSQKYIMLLMAEYCRKSHAFRVDRLFHELDQEKETIIPSRLYQTAILISHMHGKGFNDILKELKYSSKGFGSSTLHPQFAAAMLRIGDLLDIDNNRFNPYAIAHFGRLPLASLLHLKKHKSITHINVSEMGIEAEANTDEYDVALLTDEWFQTINHEVKNLICYWNQIAPESLMGCTLKQSNCTVFFNCREFDSQLKREFSINKKKLIRLLIGTSIYDTEMEFLREYIQNAMDASKMQLWLDLKNGKFESQRNPKILEYQDLTPFDLSSNVFENYRIRLLVGWNDSWDKIRLEIIDQGIGIEKEYLKMLSNIGTGWRGRTGYADELKQMVKWLYPTGGFGIGIQSAFMVTDTVVVFTKSDRENHGYKITMTSPERGGSISIEEILDYMIRGTRIVIELEPERFQDWKQSLRKQEDPKDQPTWLKNISDNDRFDEFDPDFNLSYAQDFLYDYIKKNVPNSLFSFEIACEVKKKRIYCNHYWPQYDYWKSGSGYINREIFRNGKKYLCICIPESRDISIPEHMVIWERENCVFQEIHKGAGARNACFKNILVREAIPENTKLLSQYDICIDFMGFHAEQCLKIHRNAFHEKFHVDNFCYDNFRAYLQMVWNGFLNGKTCCEKWDTYALQLIRMIISCDFPNRPFLVSEHHSMDNITYLLEIDENGSLKANQKSKLISEKELINSLTQFYQKLCRKIEKRTDDSQNTDQTDEQMPLLLCVTDPNNEYGGQERQIHPGKIIQWIKDKSQLTDDEEFINIMDVLMNGIGAIRDPYTVNILLSDTRLVHKRLIWPQQMGTDAWVVLSIKQKEATRSRQKILEYLWKGSDNVSNRKRRFVTDDEALIYLELCVSQRPFHSSAANVRFLISPISISAQTTVQRYIDQGKVMNYEVFRTLVWGKCGEESQEYHMLINWVVKHQCQGSHHSKKDIIKAYEILLKEIYQECVHIL